MVNPGHQTQQGHWNSPVKYPTWEYEFDTKESKGGMFDLKF